MKKILYLLSSMMLLFTACDPMEDVYEELDKASGDKTTVNTELVKTDYAVYSSDANYPHVASKQYLTDEAEAALLIPAMLNKKYAHLDNGATVTVTYNALKYIGLTNEVSSWEAYTVTADDYNANGESAARFNSSSDVYKFLGTKYPAAVEKQLAVLTYDQIANNVTTTIKDSFYYLNGKWENIYHVSADDYTSVKNTFGSFSGSDDANMATYFDMFLKKEVIIAKEGDFRYVSYYYYNSNGDKSRTQRIMAMYFNGTKWVPAVGATQKAVLKFEKKEDVWVPDLSILYTLTAEDYAFIGDDANNIGTAAARENLRRFGNISTYNWTEAQIYDALNAVLKRRYSSEEAGKKFKVTFDSYPAGKTTFVLIKNAAGEFVKFN